MGEPDPRHERVWNRHGTVMYGRLRHGQRDQETVIRKGYMLTKNHGLSERDFVHCEYVLGTGKLMLSGMKKMTMQLEVVSLSNGSQHKGIWRLGFDRLGPGWLVLGRRS